MKTSSYQDELLDVAIKIVHAGVSSDTRSQWDLYNVLRKAVEQHEGTPDDHPMHWETLADFTVNQQQRIRLYHKAVDAAEACQLDDRAASIYFQLAKLYYEQADIDQALRMARKSSTLAARAANISLREKACAFVLMLMVEQGLPEAFNSAHPCC